MSNWNRPSPGSDGTPPRSAPLIPPPPRWRRWVVAAVWIGVLGFTILNPFAQAPAPEALTCTAFVSDVTANQVATATITSTGAVSGTLSPAAPTPPISPCTERPEPVAAARDPQRRGHRGEPDSTSLLSVVLAYLPTLLLIGFLVWMFRRSTKQLTSPGGALGGMMNAGKSKANVYDEDKPTTRFADIAGYIDH